MKWGASYLRRVNQEGASKVFGTRRKVAPIRLGIPSKVLEENLGSGEGTTKKSQGHPDVAYVDVREDDRYRLTRRTRGKGGRGALRKRGGKTRKRREEGCCGDAESPSALWKFRSREKWTRRGRT